MLKWLARKILVKEIAQTENTVKALKEEIKRLEIQVTNLKQRIFSIYEERK